MTVIKLLGLASGGEHPDAGRWLASFDPDAIEGRGLVTGTDDRAQALRFSNAAAAMRFWRQRSKRRPTRQDGQPNRPLTAFTVEFVDDEQEPLL